MIQCAISALTNMMYYDKPIATTAPLATELKLLKTDILGTITDYVVQIQNEEICCDALRLVSNIARHKDFCKQIDILKIVDAVSILLDHDSIDIVYYAVGVLINYTIADDVRLYETPSVS
jgi:hypothetical protein